MLLLSLLALMVSLPGAGSKSGLLDDAAVICSMDDQRFIAPKEKASVSLVKGKFGKAARFSFEAGSSGVFCTSNIHGSTNWDRADGFSFWVKGDGSDSFGGLEFIYNDDYAVRYDYIFSLKRTDWTKVTLRWNDLIPVLPGPRSKPLRTPGGNLPSGMSALWFGRWWYWGEYPAQSFAIDDIRLEVDVPRETNAIRPPGAPLERVSRKLRSGEPVTIVTMGDSLTDTHHWSNRQTNWPTTLDEMLKKYRSQITVVNPAIGGTQLRQNLILMPRWLARAPEPDLVTVFFGFNDWESGMRGPEFAAACADAVDRIRRATHGKADVLLMTTAPTVAAWTAHAELPSAVREAARNRNAGLADVEKAFIASGGNDRERLFVSDKTHLSPVGQVIVARTVLQAIESGGR